MLRLRNLATVYHREEILKWSIHESEQSGYMEKEEDVYKILARNGQPYYGIDFTLFHKWNFSGCIYIYIFYEQEEETHEFKKKHTLCYLRKKVH